MTSAKATPGDENDRVDGARSFNSLQVFSEEPNVGLIPPVCLVVNEPIKLLPRPVVTGGTKRDARSD